LGYIFYEKVSDEVYGAMEESGLASRDWPGDPWIGMHPRLAWVYMTALAEQISRDQGFRPLTDETRDHLAMSGLSTERLTQALLGDVSLVDARPTATEVETILVSIAFRAVAPTDLAALDVEKILAFREKYPNERANFQNAVAELLKTREWLKSIFDPRVLEQRLREESEKIWMPKLAELREKLADVGISTMYSCFNLKETTLPAGAVGAVAALALPLNPIAAGVAGLALGAIPVLRDKRNAAKDALSASPISYLYRMEQDLKPMDLWGRVKQRSMQFALNV